MDILHDWWCIYLILSGDDNPRSQELARQAHARIQELRRTQWYAALEASLDAPKEA